MTVKARWVNVDPRKIAINIINRAGTEEAKTLLEKTYDIDMIIKYHKITLIQKDIDQNILLETVYPKKVLHSLFFLQKFKYSTDRKMNTDYKIKKFSVQV